MKKLKTFRALGDKPKTCSALRGAADNSYLSCAVSAGKSGRGRQFRGGFKAFDRFGKGHFVSLVLFSPLPLGNVFHLLRLRMVPRHPASTMGKKNARSPQPGKTNGTKYPKTTRQHRHTTKRLDRVSPSPDRRSPLAPSPFEEDYNIRAHASQGCGDLAGVRVIFSAHCF